MSVDSYKQGFAAGLEVAATIAQNFMAIPCENADVLAQAIRECKPQGFILPATLAGRRPLPALPTEVKP